MILLINAVVCLLWILIIFLKIILEIVSNTKCITNIVNIANLYINLGYWPFHFKKSTLIILKPNKSLYNISQIFLLIVLLNILRKLIEKTISSRL